VHHRIDSTQKIPVTNKPERILVIGRSPDVLVDTVAILRSKGYSADATNQFHRVLDDYDVTNLDIVVFGGMIPPDTKQSLRDAVGSRNPTVTFVQGLAGIAGLIAAQVDGVARADPPNESNVSYNAEKRAVEVNMNHAAHVTVDAYWHTSFTPPQPKSTTTQVIDTEFDKGLHTISLPDQVPSEASFVTVAVGTEVHAFTVGPMPETVTRMAATADSPDGSAGPRSELPSVAPVTTHETPAGHVVSPAGTDGERTERANRSTPESDIVM
jgi:hypothetical protein